METAIIVGNMAWNAGLIAIVGFGAKRWMDKVDTKLDAIATELKVANGRTGKIEGRLETQIAICEERNKV